LKVAINTINQTKHIVYIALLGFVETSHDLSKRVSVIDIINLNAVIFPLPSVLPFCSMIYSM
jgi:hypothetical protein